MIKYAIVRLNLISKNLACAFRINNVYFYSKNLEGLQMEFQYKALAKQMMNFEKVLVSEWAQTVNNQAVYWLKQVRFTICNNYTSNHHVQIMK